MLILPHPEWGEYLQLTVELFQELTEFFGGNWRVVWGRGMCRTGRKAGRHFCNIWILIICDLVFLDMNCVRSTFQLEPVCDQVTTLPAFLQSLPFLLSVMVLSPSGLLLANLYSIGGFSRTIAPLLIDSSILFMAFCKKMLRVCWSEFGTSSSSERSEIIEIVSWISS